MGHAAHFLSRLDRVSRDHVELALSLYQDHELLRHVLSSVRLPDGAPRVAISLEHPEQGPFLVVTREGAFVTCLGAGMRAGELPVITRGQLNGATAKVETYRARMEVRDKLLGPDGDIGRLLRRTVEAGAELSREEFVALSTVQPLLAKKFFLFTIEAAIDAHQSREQLLRILRKTDRLKPMNNPLLETLWRQFWAVGHLVMLAAMGGRDELGAIADADPPFESTLAAVTIRPGIGALALKGAWAIAKIGRPALGLFKDRFVQTCLLEELIEAAVVMTSLSLRHSKLRAEVQKALARTNKSGYASLERYRAALEELSEVVCGRADESAAAHALIGANMVMERASVIPSGSKYHFERVEDVPVDLAMSYAANHQNDFLKDRRNLTPLFLTLPWVARAAPEELYLPADFIKVAKLSWQPSQSLHLLAREAEENKRPAQRPEGPSRSGPCPCGSGKKYKRCCGDARDR